MKIGEQTCANQCERVAYQTEIKRLTKERDEAKAEVERLRKNHNALRTLNELLRRRCAQRGKALEGE